MKRQFIIDCDTGTDDAIAILCALGSSDIDILGITSVNGNVAENYVADNNLDLVEYLGFNIPVTRGAKLPLNNFNSFSDNTHGKTGLGTIKLKRSEKLEFEKDIASEFIYKKAKELNGDLELFVLGPMTNIALAIIEHSDFAKLIKHIYFMGGAIYGGNSTTTAEFNIWKDPEAAQIVFNSGIKMSMIGLDVTLKAIMEKEDILKLRDRNTNASNLAADLLDFMDKRHKNGGEDIIMHDALSIAAALYPKCLKFKKGYVDVETSGTYTRGHTSLDKRNRLKRKDNIKYAYDIDVKAFREWLVESICNI